MSTLVLTDAVAYLGGYDFTGDTNRATLGVSVDPLDVTPYGSTWRQRAGGLRSFTGALDGFWTSATSAAPDPNLFPDIGAADAVATIAPTSAEGGTAYLGQLGKFGTQTFGAVGVAVPFSVDLAGTNRAGLIRGQLVKAKGAASAVGATGSPVQLGPVAAGQYLYAALHIFAAGVSLTAVLESSADGTFAAPVTRATFGPLTTTGGTWAPRVAGPIAHPWYRLRVTAITGSFTIACSAGIGS